jgi:hypothetical protein
MQEGVMREASLQDDGSREDMVLFAAIRSDWGK